MYQSTERTDASTSQRFSHKRIDDLFMNPISADKGATYVKHLFLNLSTLSPYVSGPNSVKIATPLKQYVSHSPIRAVSGVAIHTQGAQTSFDYFMYRRQTCPAALLFNEMLTPNPI